jgi:hypothetical protein
MVQIYESSTVSEYEIRDRITHVLCRCDFIIDGNVCINANRLWLNKEQILFLSCAVSEARWDCMIARPYPTIDCVDNKTLHRKIDFFQGQVFKKAKRAHSIGRPVIVILAVCWLHISSIQYRSSWK